VTFLKWSTLGVTLLGMGSAALSVIGAATLGLELGLGMLTLVAAGVGLPLMCLVGAYERELVRLMTWLDALANEQRQPPAFGSRFGLDAIATAAQRGMTTLRQRAAELVGRRRELEIQARIAEAERKHLTAILNSISDAVIVTDAFNEIALANGAAGRILGFDAECVLRRPLDQVVRDPLLLKLIKDARESHAAMRRHVEHEIATDHDGRAIYDVRLASVNRPNGEGGYGGESAAAGVVTVLHDVTREKEIAEAKSEFVANVSHELRTPLSSIKAYMEMLIDGEADTEEARAEFYNVIQGEANRLSRLIDSILNISRIESGVIKVQREQIALPKVAKEVVDILLPQANGKRLELVLEPCPLYFQVFADRDMIHQTMLNLIGNAIKYTPEGGRIAVSLEVDEHARQVTFKVADTGLGIPEADLPHIFEKFYRVADHKAAAKGTGLGLNLVKHVIETVHGGRVGVTSTAGTGSTFTFTLPIAENA